MQIVRYGLVGSGIGSSLSPALHETEGRQHGLDLTYVLVDTDEPGTPSDLGVLLSEAEAAGLAGLNITHPFKQQVLTQLDSLSARAQAIGAVNTVVFTDGRRAGHNTDAVGFARAFERGLSGVDRKHVVQLGAGGAGAACAHAQLDLGVGRLTIVDPDHRKRGALVASLAERFGEHRVGAGTPAAVSAVLDSAAGVVNASPIGMAAHPGVPLPVELLRPGLWVFDVIYMPLETELLRAAKARGLHAVGGTEMCVFQAAAAFELLTGRVADTGRMLRHLQQLLTERREDARA
jgi:shikimate dehydrogenase